MNHPFCTLKSGLTVCNFSSPHPFTFTDGTILDACEIETVKALTLHQAEEQYERTIKGVRITDVKLTFRMNTVVATELQMLMVDGRCEIVLVPLPVMECVRLYRQVLIQPVALWKCRVVRVADRMTKTIYADRFCI